jgi:hypothetical protein
MPSEYVFIGNKNILSRTKIYRSKLDRCNKLVLIRVNGHNFDTEQKDRLCCGS